MLGKFIKKRADESLAVIDPAPQNFETPVLRGGSIVMNEMQFKVRNIKSVELVHDSSTDVSVWVSYADSGSVPSSNTVVQRCYVGSAKDGDASLQVLRDEVEESAIPLVEL